MKYDKYKHRPFYTLVLIAFFCLILLIQCTVVRAQTLWDNNPYNFKNSEYNYENSQYNYRNSPYNWENSEYNMNSKNGIYNNEGERIGYETRSREGTRNLYDNNGNRIGYGR